MPAITYLLPIRSAAPPSTELTDYLRWVSSLCRLIVVDGSPEPVFVAADRDWSAIAEHVAPDDRFRCANGKVHGVLTGLDLVTTDLVVIADDDVRYTEADLRRLTVALDHADLVMPQNYFQPLPWHARWDTARTLLNRISGGDFAGTIGVRTELLRRTGAYDGDVLFENLELMRTVAVAGGVARRAEDLYVLRLPPTFSRFGGQRVRQAYDELARPRRFVAWLLAVPTAFVLLRSRRHLAMFCVATVGLAEVGRRRHGGSSKFHWSCSLFAPAWVAERSVCVWIALVLRLRGGVAYGGRRIVVAANSNRTLRRRMAHRTNRSRSDGVWTKHDRLHCLPRGGDGGRRRLLHAARQWERG